MKLSIHKIAYLAIYVSIMVLLTFVPYTGYIAIEPISICIIPIFITVATYHLGFAGAVTTSLTFGIGSFIRAITMFPSIMVRPEMAIVPRFMLGLIIYLIIKFLGEIKLWKFVLAASLTALINTILVTAMYFIVSSYDPSFSQTFVGWMIAIEINAPLEFGAAIVLALLLYKLTKHLKKTNHETTSVKW